MGEHPVKRSQYATGGKGMGGVGMCWGVGTGEKCEKVLGEVWKSVLGCGEVWIECVGGPDVGKCWERCGKVCWGMGKVS